MHIADEVKLKEMGRWLSGECRMRMLIGDKVGIKKWGGDVGGRQEGTG